MKKQCLITASIYLLLTACGGGGGGGGSPQAADPTFPLAQAMANFIASSHNYPVTLTGNTTNKAITGSGSVNFSAATGTTFESQSALQQIYTGAGTLTVEGNTQPFSGAGTTVFTTNYNPLGSHDASEYCVARGPVIWPDKVKVGDTALKFTEDCYGDSTKGTETLVKEVTVLIEADSASTALVTVLESSNAIPSAVLLTTDLNQYRINTTGTLQWVKESLTDYSTTPSSALTATAQ